MTAPAVRSRDQVVDALVAGRIAGEWRYLGAVAPGEYAIETVLVTQRPVRRQHDVAGMSGYLDGYQTGGLIWPHLVRPADPGRVPREVHQLLTAPSVLDQRRIRVAYALEQRQWTIADVAAQLNAQRSTIRGLLAYGHQPTRVTRASRTLAEVEALLPELKRRAAGRRPAPLPPVDEIAPMSQEDRKEPIELRRTRALALATAGGLLSTWHPLDVTEMRSVRVVTVEDVRPEHHGVRLSAVIPWVQGLVDGAATTAPKVLGLDEVRDRLSILAHALA